MVEEGDYADIICLDFWKAFALVPHGMLIKTLAAYKINATHIKWIKKQITNRMQKVIVNGKLSHNGGFSTEVSQGSLSPTLFNIFIN